VFDDVAFLEDADEELRDEMIDLGRVSFPNHTPHRSKSPRSSA
jgi:hypothetical protein